MAGEKILCVDDEDPIRKLCTVYLGKRGYRVEAVANGVEALKLIESKGPPDIVVTDVNMPLMNGLELVKRLREDRRTARTTIVDYARGDITRVTEEDFTQYLADHTSGVRLLAAPPSPEEAELVSIAAVQQGIDLARIGRDAVVLDLATKLDEVTLAALDVTDIVCVVASPHLAALRSTSDTLAMLKRIGIADERILLALVRNTAKGIDEAGVAKFLKRKPDIVVPFAEKADAAADLGVPYVLAEPSDKTAVALKQLAARLATRKAVPA